MAVPASIVGKLYSAVNQWPDRVAITQGELNTSYAELWRQARGVASLLLGKGLRAGDRVALILDNSATYVAIYYGVLLAGAIVVPLNAAAKARDFTGWLKHCSPKFVFTDEGDREVDFAVTTLEAGLRQIKVGSAYNWMSSTGDVSTTVESPDTNMPAAILYTSGTTGNPKGVLLSHQNLVANTEAIIDYLNLTSADSIVSVLPFYYSYGSSVLNTHLSVGGRVILEPNLVYPQRVLRTLQEEKATGFAGVPSTFSLLLSRTRLADYDLQSLRYVTQAGGGMPPELSRRVRNAFPNARFYVMYGQTEATARLTWLPPERLDDKVGSVGVPIRGVRIEVRREDGTLAAEDEEGEVWAQGPNVMLGYWQNPEATAVALRDNWLRTGDMGHVDSEGFLYLAGRRSDIIKTGAHRVHPKDIEDVIQELDGVLEVAVVGVPDETLGESIKAHLVLEPGVCLDPMRIKLYCRERLASYKVPRIIEFRNELPKTASGKLRRKDLS